MSTLVVVGAQWGDEGKGKVTDLLAQESDIVIRYQGGNNAGHTVVIGPDTFKLHLIPSGIIHPAIISIIGNGVVIDPIVLTDELDGLAEKGITDPNLQISDRAHVIMPYHVRLDQLEEESRGNSKIGTTGRGIGPAYADKVSRSGIRVADLVDADRLRRKLEAILPAKNLLLEKLYGAKGFSVEEIFAMYAAAARRLRPFVTDSAALVAQAIDAGKRVLFEGAQGTLLDIDHGTYPFVTSSSPTAGGATIGTGVGPTAIDRVLGVTKAYSTRVGAGPFPTELDDAQGDHIRDQGHEFGTTTGRPRRCGWLDIVALRYAVRVNGIGDLALTKLDVLSGLDTIRVCTAYRVGGQSMQELPESLDALENCEPVYEEFPGWTEDISNITAYEDLPENAKVYVKRIGELLGAEMALVSVGPGREQTIILKPLF